MTMNSWHQILMVLLYFSKQQDFYIMTQCVPEATLNPIIFVSHWNLICSDPTDFCFSEYLHWFLWELCCVWLGNTKDNYCTTAIWRGLHYRRPLISFTTWLLCILGLVCVVSHNMSLLFHQVCNLVMILKCQPCFCDFVIDNW